jgi:hypothetical protein
MKPSSVIFQKHFVHYLVISNTIWIDIQSVCMALDLDEEEEVQFLAKHKSLNMIAKEFMFVFSETFAEQLLCIPELQLYQWLEHLSFSSKSNIRDVFIEFLYREFRTKVHLKKDSQFNYYPLSQKNSIAEHA